VSSFEGEQFVVHFDLPGVDPASIDIGVERNVLTVKAERKPTTGDLKKPVAGCTYITSKT
jgi:HSP20 family protein